MWVTALLSLAALYITGCVDANGALGGFANVNTILMGACFMVASGFRRTSLVKIMCDWLLKLTNGSFMKVYFGYLLLGVLLTNFMGSPMVVYAIIGPLLCALCDLSLIHICSDDDRICDPTGILLNWWSDHIWKEGK